MEIKVSNQQKNSQQLWLCIRLPYLSLNIQNIRFNSTPCVAVIDKQSIWQCNHGALASGIRLGMTHSQVLLISSEIILLERKFKPEDVALKKLCSLAYRYSSQITLYNPFCILLEIGKSIPLFRGMKHLIHLIANDLEQRNYDFELGLAHTPKAAYVLSFNKTAFNGLANQAGKPNSTQILDQLNSCSISTLDVEASILNKLAGLGIQTLGELSEFCKMELSQRFGLEFLQYLEQLSGEQSDLQAWLTPTETFHMSLDFAEPISNRLWIQQQIEHLLAELHHFLVQRMLYCRSFIWRFYQQGNQLLETITINLSGKHHNLDSFIQLTALKLEQHPFASEITAIELLSTQLTTKEFTTPEISSQCVNT